MKSAPRGDDTSVEVSGISPHGVWLLLGDEEVFLSFKKFPWFRKAPVGGVLHVERPQPHHIYWPDLDIDLTVESIHHPKRFPLISRERPSIAGRVASRKAGKKPAAQGSSTPPKSKSRSRRAGRS